MSEPSVLLEAHGGPGGEGRSFAFAHLQEVLIARLPQEVPGVLEGIERALGRGLHAAGYLAYEAAPGLDPALVTRAPQAGWPLAWFGVFGERRQVRAGELEVEGEYQIGAWEPSISQTRYGEAVEAIRQYIARGHTYQVNFSFRLRACFRGDGRALYRDLCRAQGAAFCAFVDTGQQQILSASPELFFRLRDGCLTARPMKGTRPRGRWPAEDGALAGELCASPKERAENAMIVDLLRNDLGRVAVAGSVKVPRLWEVERYETVWQLTSTVGARLRQGVGLGGLLASLFPCGSVTGAPKVRTMEIIAELEDGPRGVYTGCIGYVSPGPEACFNVAIRTVSVDREQGRAEFGVGGGITWDSSPEGEYGECLVKARVLAARRPPFRLLETLRWSPEQGFFLLERHLQRLRESAAYFGFCCEEQALRERLQERVRQEGEPQRVRLLLARDGEIAVECRELGPGAGPLRARLAAGPVDSQDVFLFHKTTHRQVYERALEGRPESQEVVLYNERGELTECCSGNLVVELEGGLWTPPLECGLLAGTFRAELLARGAIHQRLLRVEQLARAGRLYLVNSVREWVPLNFLREST